MGRVSRSEASQNRIRIVEVASRLFRSRGFEEVSISDVMKAAGMTQGGFYTHFESKEDLAVEACTSSFSISAAAWNEVAIESVGRGRDGLTDLVSYYLAAKEPEMSCPMVSLASDAARCASDHPMRIAYEDGVQLLFETFAAVAKQSDKSRDAAQMLFAAMVGANMLAHSTNGGGSVDKMKRTVKAAGAKPSA